MPLLGTAICPRCHPASELAGYSQLSLRDKMRTAGRTKSDRRDLRVLLQHFELGTMRKKWISTTLLLECPQGSLPARPMNQSRMKTAIQPYRTFSPPHVLSDALRDFQRTQPGRDFQTLIGLLPPEWQPYVMGGLLRDLLLERVLKIRAKSPDIDIVIFGARSIEEVRDRLGSTILSTNAFGGMKCRLRPKGPLFDLWRVEDHTNMARAAKPHTIEQLLRHNLLDIDAILWDPKTDCLHDCGCLSAITAERIGLQGKDGVSERAVAAQIAHVLTVAYKTNFPLSSEVRGFVSKASRRREPAEVEAILKRKIPHAAGLLENFWKDIRSGGTQACPVPTRAPVMQTARPKRSSSLLNTRH